MIRRLLRLRAEEGTHPLGARRIMTKNYEVPRLLRWLLGGLIVVAIVAIPTLRHRWVYTDAKRLREVRAGVYYRCGCLTGNGFERALQHYQIRTVINLMEEDPDPNLSKGYFGGERVREVDLCKKHNARYETIVVDFLTQKQLDAGEQPKAIAQFLKIMEEAPKPVLVHCKAGLNRTGVITAIYRMEYEGWTPAEALKDLRDNGFGESTSLADNVYVKQYVMMYQPGRRSRQAAATQR